MSIDDLKKQALLAPRIISLAILGTLVIYVGIGYWLTKTMEPMLTEPLVKYVLAFLGLCILPASFLVKRLMLGQSRIESAIAGLSRSSPGSAPRQAETAGPRGYHPAVMKLFMPALIIPLAMCETAGLLGMMIAILYGDRNFLLGLNILAGVCIILHFPWGDTLEQLQKTVDKEMMKKGMTNV